MDKKCSYCWQLCKVEKNLVLLECHHSICRKCLLFLEFKKITNCPFCLEKFFYEEIIEDSELFNKDSLSKMTLSTFKSLSEVIQIHLKSLKLLNLFTSLPIKLSSQNSLEVFSIISDLHLIKNSKVLELINLDHSHIKTIYNSYNFKKYFKRILFSKSKLYHCENHTVWLGNKFVSLRNVSLLKEKFLIRNDGKTRVLLNSIGFGKSLISPEKIYIGDIYLIKNGETYKGIEKLLKMDKDGISFVANLPNIEIEPNEKIEIFFKHEEGLHIAVKNQVIHNYKNCVIAAASEQIYSIILYLKFN